MKMNLKKGFTLIELLVVVAIIGILASVVLASLNTARAKGADAAVKANLANMRAQAAIYYDANNGYGAAGTGTAGCATALSLFADPVILGQVAGAVAAGGGFKSCTTTAGSAGSWAAAVQLKSLNTLAWCVDASGASKQETIANSQLGLDAVITAGGLCL